MRHLPTLAPEPEPWAAYRPSPEVPWDVRRVVHLHRRAGFAATWADVERDLKEGPEASVGRVMAGRSRIGGVPENFESTAAVLAEGAVASGDIKRLAAWWVFRMLATPDPLGERLTLMWHNHFATAASKVENVEVMRRQNDQFRTLARARYGDLLNAAARDPGLLVYLDAPRNGKGRPNENLARELLELFTVGRAAFTETDVREAARALTGWTAEDGEFREAAPRHDPGEKTVLGRTGPWRGSDLLAILARHPATARRVATRICGLLMGEGAADDVALSALADILRANQLDVGRTVEVVLGSRAFFSAANIGSRVKGPVDYAIGACRALLPPGALPSTLLLAEWIARMGQELFEPPNVGGWPEGRAWLTGPALVARANFAVALVQGRPIGLPGPLDASAVAREQRRGPAAHDIQVAAATLLAGVEPRDLKPPAGHDPSETARRALASVLASPEAQLG